MKGFLKRVLSVLLALVLLIGVLAGCTGSSQQQASGTEGTTSAVTATTGSDSGENFQKEGLPIVKEPVTLDILTVRWPNMGDSFKENKFLQDLEKSTNVKIEWQVEGWNDWESTRRPVLLASGTLPGMILGDIALREIDILNNLAYFLPLDELIDKYMPNYKQIMTEDPYMKSYVTYPDGKIYSMGAKLPARPLCSHQPIINKAWLDRLGLQVPTNIDELYQVLKAFKEKDANGNGDPNDEIPFTGSAKDSFIDPTILILFGINELNGLYMSLFDDKPTFFPVGDQYKEAVKTLNKWYSEGLIDQEYFTQDWTQLDAKRKNADVSLVGFAFGWVPDAYFTTTKAEYIMIPPIAGLDGKKYAMGDPNGLAYRRKELEITKFCKYPEVAARWADQFYTDEASIQNFWGAIGTVIQKNSDDTYTLMDPPADKSADAWYWDSSLRDFGPKYVRPEFQKKLMLPKDSGDGLKLELDKMGRDFVTKPLPNVLLSLEESEEMATIKTDIEKYVQVTAAQWITKGGVETEWDAYVKKLEDMGLKRMVEIYTAAYGRFEGSK